MDRSKFYKYLKNNLTPKLSQGQVDGLEACLNEGEKRGVRTTDLAAIMAEAWHETGGSMEPITENLNYSAKRLTEVWPSRFPTLASAQPYANNPQKLANKVYGGRLGNTGPNDGWLYAGRGLSQITGKSNYAKFGIEKTPEKALELPTAVHILFEGMIKGMFTGKKLSDYNLPAQYAASRAIINADVKTNGTKIQQYANIFQGALTSAGYK